MKSMEPKNERLISRDELMENINKGFVNGADQARACGHKGEWDEFCAGITFGLFITINAIFSTKCKNDDFQPEKEYHCQHIAADLSEALKCMNRPEDVYNLCADDPENPDS